MGENLRSEGWWHWNRDILAPNARRILLSGAILSVLQAFLALKAIFFESLQADDV